MKQRGFFYSLCRSLDCIEGEVNALCRIFCREKPKKKPCGCEEKRAMSEFCFQPDFCPPCGQECCCCKKEKRK